MAGSTGHSSTSSSASSSGFLKHLQESKLKSFSIGTMGKRTLSKREQDELRKKQEQDEVGKVYKEFVSTFEDHPSSKVNKTWVKAGTFNAGNRKEDFTEKGKLYQPASRMDSGARSDLAESSALDGRTKRPEKPGKKKEKEKKKSNLEIFKEELKAIQEEREERHRVKNMIRSGAVPPSALNSTGSSGSVNRELSLAESAASKDGLPGSHDTGDPNTTNLYLGNLSPRLTEQQMMELFGKYGPLASIKIMWPRTEDEKSRGRNCGFVAYMSRIDGERALTNLSGQMIDGHEMRMGWGKPVPIPLHPIYVPPPLLKLTLPPPPSGLPFNAQPNSKKDADTWNIGKGPLPGPSSERTQESFDKLLYRSTVKVVIPTDRTVLCLINRMVEFVIREGPMFEAMIMNRELSNPNFAFLFENKSPEHVYYRWRLYSLMQGDSKDHWGMEPFRMFKGGSMWKPPIMNIFTAGMPDHLVEEEEEHNFVSRDRESKSRKDSENDKSSSKSSRRGLSNSQRDRFEDMLRTLYPDRNPIAETMVWCLEHADAWEEIVDCVSEALSALETSPAKKIARLYLISDILHNCSVKGVPNVSYYRKGFQAKLPDIFHDLAKYQKAIDSRMKAEAFKERVTGCFRAWEDWALYPQDFLIKLQNIFLGLIGSGNTSDSDGENGKKGSDEANSDDEDDDDVDGMPLDGAALLKSAQKGKGFKRRKDGSDDSDVDGTPIKDGKFSSRNSGLSGTPKAGGGAAPAGFVPSKWETVHPDEVQAQAVTSKWELFDQDEELEKRKRRGITDPDDDDDDLDGEPLGGTPLDARAIEDRRVKLREIELKVIQYQDELESGRITRKPGWTISEQVELFRKKLRKQTLSGKVNNGSDTAGSGDDTDEQRTRTPRGNRDDTDDSLAGSHTSRRKKKSKRSRRSSSSSRSRSRSRERGGRKRSRSRKRHRKSSSSSSEERRPMSSSSSKRDRRSRSKSPKRHKKKSGRR
ncbi:hypothetical protein TCAL_00982 [Tigriopus californicus]|uniref:U2 snRNP-associated SURP motif-containing protein n=1 Tax=Tigriopus californicus TaxID=6832 RepID=A0A553P4Y1_TIGCA|nr:U2 snRNP-associated SURP motif-containing protein-like [Tigriopus californicus]TRY72722.1 hypothetical protein TCAL_00982 [Tigriopus californicus]